MLEAYLPYFSSRYGEDIEFLVVVNGSTDRTEHVVRGYAEQYPCVREIVEPKRIGKGGALKLGFEEATGDLIGFSDADGSTPPEAFDDLVGSMGDAGAVIASRWCKGSTVSPKQPLVRRIASRVFNLLTRMLFRLPLSDTQCGAKLMRREALRAVLPRLGITRWAFDVDLLFQLKTNGSKVTEIPTIWRDVAGSKIDIGRASFDMFAALLRLRLLYSPFRWVVTLYDMHLGPFIHPPGLEHDRLFRHSLLLLAAQQGGNALSLISQVVLLSKLSTRHYGVMAAVLGFVATVTAPLGAVGRTVSHFAARSIKKGDSVRVKSLMLTAARDLSFFGIPLVLVILASRQWLAEFFRFESSTPLLIVCAVLLMSLYKPVMTGALNGAQAFAWISSNNLSGAFLRLVLVVLFLLFGWGAVGVLSAHALSVLFVLAMHLVALRHILGPGMPGRTRIRGTYSYLLQYAIGTLCVSIFLHGDVIAVKHYFGAEEAGLFAKVSMVAHLAILLPAPVVGAMFPKVVSSGAASYGNWRTLQKALSLVLLIVGGVALPCIVFSRHILVILTGDRADSLVPVLRAMILALSVVSILLVVSSFQMAQRRFIVLLPLTTCMLGFVVGVTFWHEKFIHVAWVLATSSALCLVFCVASLPWRGLKQEA